jgi:nicotinamide riboside transporter PnuC
MKDIVALLGALLLRLLFVAPFMLLFWWLRRSARNRQPKEEAGVLEFSLAPGIRIVISIAIVALMAFTGVM